MATGLGALAAFSGAAQEANALNQNQLQYQRGLNQQAVDIMNQRPGLSYEQAHAVVLGDPKALKALSAFPVASPWGTTPDNGDAPGAPPQPSSVFGDDKTHAEVGLSNQAASPYQFNFAPFTATPQAPGAPQPNASLPRPVAVQPKPPTAPRLPDLSFLPSPIGTGASVLPNYRTTPNPVSALISAIPVPPAANTPQPVTKAAQPRTVPPVPSGQPQMAMPSPPVLSSVPQYRPQINAQPPSLVGAAPGGYVPSGPTVPQAPKQAPPASPPQPSPGPTLDTAPGGPIVPRPLPTLPQPVGNLYDTPFGQYAGPSTEQLIWNNRLGVQQDRNDITNNYDQGRLDNNQDRNDTLSMKDILGYATRYPNNPTVQAFVSQLLGGSNGPNAGAGGQGAGSVQADPLALSVTPKVTTRTSQPQILQTPSPDAPKPTTKLTPPQQQLIDKGSMPATYKNRRGMATYKNGQYFFTPLGGKPEPVSF